MSSRTADVYDAAQTASQADYGSRPRHTRGPWRLAEGNERSSTDCQYIWPDAAPGEAPAQDESPFCIATVHPRSDSTEMGANASLIAAGPDLLEACQQAELWLSQEDRSIEPIEMLRVLRAAIAKAEGRS